MGIKLLNEFYYRVQTRDSVDLVCQKFNTSKENILRNNDNIKLYPGEVVKIKVNDFITYVVKPMDTLDAIAEKFNVSTQKLVEDNSIKSKRLFIGQWLKIYDKKKEKI